MTTTLSLEQRRENARATKPGAAIRVIQKGEYAVWFRHLQDGRWAVLVGWRVMEGVGDDPEAQRAVNGLEGVCHEAYDYDFGADFDGAHAYYVECCERLKDMQEPRKLSLPRTR